MPTNAQNVARELIAYAIVTDKRGVVKLLERNGIQMPSEPTDNQVTIAVLTASSKSPNFKSELSKYLTSKSKSAANDFASFAGSDDFGFTGLDDFSFTGEDAEFFSILGLGKSKEERQAAKQTRTAARTERRASKAPTTEEGEQARVGFWQSLKNQFFSEDTINQGINLGLTAINTRVQGRQNAAQAEALLLQQRQDEMKRQLAKQQGGGLSTMSWVFIGVGLLAIGGIVYYATKKK